MSKLFNAIIYCVEIFLKIWFHRNLFLNFSKYAEFIEDKLLAIGLTVDLLYPNEDVPIRRVLANICSRGCMYAILVLPQNQENHSLTLNILHGSQQGESLLYIFL